MGMSVNVETRDQRLNRLRKVYMTEHFPAWINRSPGQPGFVSNEDFIKASKELNTHSITAQVSITGEVWDSDNLDVLNNRSVDGFLKLLPRTGYVASLISSYEKVAYKQGII